MCTHTPRRIILALVYYTTYTRGAYPAVPKLCRVRNCITYIISSERPYIRTGERLNVKRYGRNTMYRSRLYLRKIVHGRLDDLSFSSPRPWGRLEREPFWEPLRCVYDYARVHGPGSEEEGCCVITAVIYTRRLCTQRYNIVYTSPPPE